MHKKEQLHQLSILQMSKYPDSIPVKPVTPQNAKRKRINQSTLEKFDVRAAADGRIASRRFNTLHTMVLTLHNALHSAHVNAYIGKDHQM